MLSNIRKNRFWFWKAIVTYGLGMLFLINSNAIGGDPGRRSLVAEFDDPPFIFIIGIVATLAMVYALWDVRHLAYKTVMTSSLTAVWLLFFVVLTIYDIERGHCISFENGFALMVLLSIVHEITMRG